MPADKIDQKDMQEDAKTASKEKARIQELENEIKALREAYADVSNKYRKCMVLLNHTIQGYLEGNLN